MTEHVRNDQILVLGATGKTGRRVAERLRARGANVRAVSRQSTPPFDWTDRATYAPALRRARAVYVTYQPDVAVPGALEDIEALTALAREQGVGRIVMLSGRGEEQAEACEQVVRDSGLEWTVLRANWFCQNFSEDYLLDSVLSGTVALPAGDVPEPFVDTGDIADVAVAALTQDGHAGRTYELSGPRALTFTEAVAEIAKASGRHDLRFVRISPEEYAATLRRYEVPDDVVSLLLFLFGTVLDGRNADPRDGVRQALGRGATDFAAYAQQAAATGVWAG